MDTMAHGDGVLVGMYFSISLKVTPSWMASALLKAYLSMTLVLPSDGNPTVLPGVSQAMVSVLAMATDDIIQASVCEVPPRFNHNPPVAPTTRYSHSSLSQYLFTS